MHIVTYAISHLRNCGKRPLPTCTYTSHWANIEVVPTQSISHRASIRVSPQPPKANTLVVLYLTKS